MRWLARIRIRSTAALALLLFADVWSLVTIVTATTSGEGGGAVFWTAIAIIAILLAVLINLTIRVARLLRGVNGAT